MSRRIPSPILLGLLHGSGLASDHQIEKIADKIFGNVDLSIKEHGRIPSPETQQQLIAKAATKRARKAKRGRS